MIDLDKLRAAYAKADEYLARYALVAAVRSTETRSRLSPKGRQSGPKGNAQKPIP